jgi:ubiquinone/menaquinone biosynthesis C-methylase UbiE
MGLFSVFGNVRGGYSKAESLLFDRVIVKKVAGPLHDAAMAGITPLVESGMRILDVGCGGGQFALALADQFPDVEIVGLDLSHEQVVRATGRAEGRTERVSFVQGSALALPFSADEFDLVFSIGSLKHWPDHELGLRECARVARLGAPLFVMEADRGCRHEDLVRLVTALGVPSRLHPLATAAFRVGVTGQALDLVDARAIVERIETITATVERIEGLPILAVAGTRA